MRKILYHGSDVILKKPLYGVGKEDNDYGSGFFTTEDIRNTCNGNEVNPYGTSNQTISWRFFLFE